MRLLCIQIRISWWFWIQVQMSAFYLLSTVQQASGHVREMSFDEDAQGGKLETRGTRRARVTVKALDGSNVSIEDTFILANVQNVLISFGRLLRKQWRLVEQHGVESGLALEAPDGSCRTAVVFRRNSLVRGQICSCNDCCSPVSAEHGRWYTTSDGTPYCKSTGHCFVDASGHWSQYWPYRQAT